MTAQALGLRYPFSFFFFLALVLQESGKGIPAALESTTSPRNPIRRSKLLRQIKSPVVRLHSSNRLGKQQNISISTIQRSQMEISMLRSRLLENQRIYI
jgi:hypothetical protein